MPNDEAQPGVAPSLLDRLIDPEAVGSRWQRGYSVAQMVGAVRRDLEDLLNTRQARESVPAEFGQLYRSVYAYGLPDVVSLEAATPEQREAIGRMLEDVVGRFEPRLREVRATQVGAADGRERTVRFRITAKLSVDPAPEVAFDTILELTTGHYSVQTGGA